jgi:mono/diheme cytochrome c family protein
MSLADDRCSHPQPREQHGNPDQGVAIRADEVELPATSSEVIAEGGKHSAGSCVSCDGAPGQDPAQWSRDLRPEPPHLTEAANEWSPEESHWIVENGIKMSGMPAFGSHHGTEEIAAIAAFVAQMPRLSARDYAAMTGSAGRHHAGTAGPQ